MAQIVSHSFVVTVSKLVKDSVKHEPIVTDDQVHTVTHTLPGILEELLSDATLIVEVQHLSD
jgi:hypothetical protein